MSTKAPCIAFRNAPGYRGERVVPFEDLRGKEPWERAELTFSTTSTRAPGSLKGLLIQDREDAAAAQRRGGYPAHPRTQPSFWAARDWALRNGFRGVQVYAAAAAALILRKEHGQGNVTVEMVRELMATAS